MNSWNTELHFSRFLLNQSPDQICEAVWRRGSWAAHMAACSTWSLFTGVQMGHIKLWQVELRPVLLLRPVRFVVMTCVDVETAVGLSAA